MKKAVSYITIITVCAVLFSCRETYTSPQITTNNNYLVVEGLINTGTDSTFIKLSRTVKLNAKTATQAETQAKVTVESDAGATYLLKEITRGTYASAPLGLSKTAKYRLRIITNTNDHPTYLSDFTVVKESPPIDTVGYAIQPNGLRVYVNTHDATSNTRYYRWEYIETWGFHSAITSSYIASGTKVLRRTPAQDIWTCWASGISTDIILASSVKLTQDVIYQGIITTVPSTSEKVSFEYSILVKQYALTQDAFNFWQNLKKNTELLGGIFDAQPSQIQGNIHNINDATEPVFGYISAGTFQQKRLTLTVYDLPNNWGPPYPGCVLDTIRKVDWSYRIFGPGADILLTDSTKIVIKVPPPKFRDTAYVGTTQSCADCTLRGTNKRPPFFPF